MTESSEARKARKAAEVAFAHSTLINIKGQTELWSEYDLDDNAKLRIKPLVLDIRKSNAPGPDGNYIYHIRANVVIDVQQPAKKTKKQG